MKTFVASSSKVEVNGETIYSIVDGMGAFKTSAIKLLSENGIIEVKPGQWYNQQSWLNAFKTISEKVGNATLFNIGIAIPENAKFPPEIKEAHQALGAIDIAYRMNHRGGEIGSYKYSKTGEKSAVVVCNNPYPDEFDRGLITAMCRKFLPQGTLVTVAIDAAKPSRSKGGDSTTYNVSWK